MRPSRVLSMLLIALAFLAATAATSAAQRGCRGMGMGGDMAKPVFTAEQKEQMAKIEAKYEGDRVDLRNKMAAMRLEMRDMLTAAEPDFSKIESKIDEIAAVHVRLAKLRLKQHVDVRGILTPDQKKLFDRGFGACCGDGDGRMSCGMGAGMGCGMGMPGCGMTGGDMGMKGCMPGCRMMGGAGVAPGATGQGHPGCPMMGATGGGAVQGMTKQRSERWRRWL